MFSSMNAVSFTEFINELETGVLPTSIRQSFIFVSVGYICDTLMQFSLSQYMNDRRNIGY